MTNPNPGTPLASNLFGPSRLTRPSTISQRIPTAESLRGILLQKRRCKAEAWFVSRTWVSGSPLQFSLLTCLERPLLAKSLVHAAVRAGWPSENSTPLHLEKGSVTSGRFGERTMNSLPSKWMRRVWVANCWLSGDIRNSLNISMWALWRHHGSCSSCMRHWALSLPALRKQIWCAQARFQVTSTVCPPKGLCPCTCCRRPGPVPRRRKDGACRSVTVATVPLFFAALLVGSRACELTLEARIPLLCGDALVLQGLIWLQQGWTSFGPQASHWTGWGVLSSKKQPMVFSNNAFESGELVVHKRGQPWNASKAVVFGSCCQLSCSVFSFLASLELFMWCGLWETRRRTWEKRERFTITPGVMFGCPCPCGLA